MEHRADGGSKVEKLGLTPGFMRASRKLIEIFSKVAENGRMDELKGELDALEAAGESEVSDRFYELLGATREETDEIFAELRSEVAFAESRSVSDEAKD